MLIPMAANDRWSLDFVSDQLTDGRGFPVLTVVDDCTRECLALVADTSLSGLRVAREPDRIIEKRGKPRMIVSCRARSVWNGCAGWLAAARATAIGRRRRRAGRKWVCATPSSAW